MDIFSVSLHDSRSDNQAPFPGPPGSGGNGDMRRPPPGPIGPGVPGRGFEPGRGPGRGIPGRGFGPGGSADGGRGVGRGHGEEFMRGGDMPRPEFPGGGMDR